jgi:hypothetical protein
LRLVLRLILRSIKTLREGTRTWNVIELAVAAIAMKGATLTERAPF